MRPSSPFCLPASGLEDIGQRRHSESTAELQRLELQNTQLRRKLSKARLRSRERVLSVDNECKQLSSENVALRHECENLRSLFIRQQQQQIAFWAGPFMEMGLPKSGTHVAAEEITSMKLAPALDTSLHEATRHAVMAAASPAKAGMKHLPGTMPHSAIAGDVHPALKHVSADETLVKTCFDPPKRKLDMPEQACAGRPECVQSLLKDRDYWQNMASQLQKEIPVAGTPVVQLSLVKGTVGSLHGAPLPSSSSAESEFGGTGETTWSDSGTESTRSTAET